MTVQISVCFIDVHLFHITNNTYNCDCLWSRGCRTLLVCKSSVGTLCARLLAGRSISRYNVRDSFAFKLRSNHFKFLGNSTNRARDCLVGLICLLLLHHLAWQDLAGLRPCLARSWCKASFCSFVSLLYYSFK